MIDPTCTTAMMAALEQRLVSLPSEDARRRALYDMIIALGAERDILRDRPPRRSGLQLDRDLLQRLKQEVDEQLRYSAGIARKEWLAARRAIVRGVPSVSGRPQLPEALQDMIDAGYDEWPGRGLTEVEADLAHIAAAVRMHHAHRDQLLIDAAALLGDASALLEVADGPAAG